MGEPLTAHWEDLVDVHGLDFPAKVKRNDEGTYMATVGDVKFSGFRYR